MNLFEIRIKAGDTEELTIALPCVEGLDQTPYDIKAIARERGDHLDAILYATFDAARAIASREYRKKYGGKA